MNFMIDWVHEENIDFFVDTDWFLQLLILNELSI